MKFLQLFAAIAVPVLLVAADAPPSALKEFASKEGGFSVLLPGTPNETKIPIPAPPGGKRTTQYLFAVNRGNGAYLVSYQDNPELEKVSAEKAQEALKRAQTGVQNMFNGKLMNEKAITFQGNPGREFSTEVPAGPGVCRSRIYLVKGRLYQLIAVGVKEFPTTPEAEQFFNSFKLTK
jgi:hypothetical protein